jgi:hypothetical protein
LEFTEKVTHVFGPERASLLLRNFHPSLHGRPIEILTDHPDRSQKCLDVILESRSGARR